jgi:hypothetical protein
MGSDEVNDTKESQIDTKTGRALQYRIFVQKNHCICEAVVSEQDYGHEIPVWHRSFLLGNVLFEQETILSF